nr:uncharacterized protein LOC111503860 [Leptinotarsa decemlineata]
MSTSVKIILAIIATTSAVGSVTITECEDHNAMPASVSITNCSKTDSLCKIKNNQEVTISMSFNAPCYLERITPVLKVKSIFGEENIPVDSEQRDGCLGILNTFCPLVKQENIQYKVSMKFNLLSLIPHIMTFKLMDPVTNYTALCFKTNFIPFSW